MLLSNLFGRGRPEEADPQGSPSPGTRLYAIGDVHGRLDLLTALQEMIARDAAAAGAERNLVVYLGDYIDRGPDSRGVIDRLIDAPLAGFESVTLRGNHEQVLLDFLEDPMAGLHWLAFGGLETLASYGVAPPARPAAPAQLEEARQALAEALPARHRAFYQGLASHHVEGDFALVHAGIRPGIALDAQTLQDLLWIREPFLRSTAPLGKIVIHGHTITEAPDLRINRIGIDTGAYRTGRLTCIVLQDGARSFLQT